MLLKAAFQKLRSQNPTPTNAVSVPCYPSKQENNLNSMYIYFVDDPYLLFFVLFVKPPLFQSLSLQSPVQRRLSAVQLFVCLVST